MLYLNWLFICSAKLYAYWAHYSQKSKEKMPFTGSGQWIAWGNGGKKMSLWHTDICNYKFIISKQDIFAGVFTIALWMCECYNVTVYMVRKILFDAAILIQTEWPYHSNTIIGYIFSLKTS